MSATLLPYLRCPECSQTLAGSTPETLTCRGCARVFPIRHGVPRFTGEDFTKGVTDTAASFGYMWGKQAALVVPPTTPSPYHLAALQEALGAPPFEGLILDAGCGEGIDLSMVALDPRCEAIGVELSDGGVETSLARTRGLDRAHIVQGDLLRIPLADATFDGAYSYGVVHHTPDPPRAVREIARTLKPGAPLLLYVYEDFSDRSLGWRVALTVANSARLVTTKLPSRLLMRICRMLSPIVWLFLTVPSRHFRWASRFPYRHGTTPSSMSGDLYNRLSAPIEKRYSKDGAAALAASAGLRVERVAALRGWAVHATKPV